MATPSTKQFRKISKDISNTLIRWSTQNVPPVAFSDLMSIREELEAAIEQFRANQRSVALVCEYCNVKFRGWNEDQKYCSKPCQGRAVWEKRCQKMAEKNELNLQDESKHN
jgi:hypothetical protein